MIRKDKRLDLTVSANLFALSALMGLAMMMVIQEDSHVWFVATLCGAAFLGNTFVARRWKDIGDRLSINIFRYYFLISFAAVLLLDIGFLLMNILVFFNYVIATVVIIRSLVLSCRRKSLPAIVWNVIALLIMALTWYPPTSLYGQLWVDEWLASRGITEGAEWAKGMLFDTSFIPLILAGLCYLALAFWKTKTLENVQEK